MKFLIEIPDGFYCVDCKFCCLDHTDYNYCSFLEDYPLLHVEDELGEHKVAKDKGCPSKIIGDNR
jgi:hypothetical protein